MFSPRFDVTFYGAKSYIYDTPRRGEVRYAYEKHSLYCYDVAIPGRRVPVVPEKTPVSITWGQPPNAVYVDYGYVNHTEWIDDSGDPGSPYLRVWIVGTSLHLNEPNPQSWQNVSASYIAKMVGDREGYRVITHKSKMVLDYWTPGTGSEWRMLHKLAAKVGYRLWVNGSTLYFLDPSVLLKSPTYKPVEFDMNYTPMDTITRFQSLDGSLVPTPATASVTNVYGIDRVTSSLIKTSSAKQLNANGQSIPSHTKISPISVYSIQEAELLTQGEAILGAWNQAKVELKYGWSLRPGDIVNLTGGALSLAHQGLWIVAAVNHVTDYPADGGQFWNITTTANLIRNQQDATYFTTNSGLKNAPAPMPCVLRNGRWESAQRGAIYE